MTDHQEHRPIDETGRQTRGIQLVRFAAGGEVR